MSDQFKILPGVIAPVTPGAARGSQRNGSKPAAGASFGEILDRQRGREVRFSRHAQERMASRGISLSTDELARLEQAVSTVEAKGGRDSLVLMGDKALVVSVKNQTVVTVVDREGLKGNVFTNIDSAIIA